MTDLPTDLPEDPQLRSLLQQHAEYHAAPKYLREQLLRQTLTQQSASLTTQWLSWLSAPVASLSASFALGALLAVLITGHWVSGQPQQQAMLLALASDHARAIVTQSTMEVRSSNLHTVKPWLSSQLGYSPRVVDLSAQGFPLLGGRKGYIGGMPVAVAVYGYRLHEIDVYALTDAMHKQFPPRLREVDGFNTTSWESGDLHYIAISDMNAEQLKIFGKLLQTDQALEQ